MEHYVILSSPARFETRTLCKTVRRILGLFIQQKRIISYRQVNADHWISPFVYFAYEARLSNNIIYLVAYLRKHKKHELLSFRQTRNSPRVSEGSIFEIDSPNKKHIAEILRKDLDGYRYGVNFEARVEVLIQDLSIKYPRVLFANRSCITANWKGIDFVFLLTDKTGRRVQVDVQLKTSIERQRIHSSHYKNIPSFVVGSNESDKVILARIYKLLIAKVDRGLVLHLNKENDHEYILAA